MTSTRDEHAACHPPRRVGRVLIVDDEPDHLQLIRAFIAPVAGHIVTASDGLAGLDLARRAYASGEPFDLVLLDQRLPGMEGTQLCRVIRQETLAKAVIAVTACAMAGDRQRMLDAGFDDYISKPLDPGSLRDACVAHGSPAGAPANRRLSA